MAEIRGNVQQAAGPLDQLRDPGEVFKIPVQVEFVRTLVQFLKTGFSRCVMRDQATSAILMLSPGGKVHSLTVADDGTVTATYVRG